MISIFLTEELERIVKGSPNTNLVYYFCDNKDDRRSTAAAILRGLVLQLLKQCRPFHRHILPVFDIQGEELFADSSFEALWRIFEAAARDPEVGTIYCVLDGLDECDDTSLEVLLIKFRTLFLETHSIGGLKVITVSREHPDFIIRELSWFPRIRLDPDSSTKVNEDLRQYIAIKVGELSSEMNYSNELREYVEHNLISRAEGTFLWIGFVVQELKRKRPVEVKATLESIPIGLDEIYGRILLQIEDSRRETAARVLRWVVMAFRPLTLAELSAAIQSMLPNSLAYDDAIRDYVEFCGPFLKLTDSLASLQKDDTFPGVATSRLDNFEVGLVHQSAKDYLLRGSPDNNPVLERFRVNPGEANMEIAHVCYDYLHNLSAPIFVSSEIVPTHLIPFLTYAVLYWPKHAKLSPDSIQHIFDLSGAFCKEDSSLFRSWLSTYRHRMGSAVSIPYTYNLPYHSSLLVVACSMGIASLALKILQTRTEEVDHGRPSNQESLRLASALDGAISNQQEAIVILLLKLGALITPSSLEHAIATGNEAMVRLLVDNGADLSQSETGTPLFEAASRGDVDMVRFLLQRGCTVDAKNAGVEGTEWWTPLHGAALMDHQSVVALLIAHGANVNEKTPDGRTILWTAVRMGHESVLRLLLDAGSTPRAFDIETAEFHGRSTIAQMLRDACPEVQEGESD